MWGRKRPVVVGCALLGLILSVGVAAEEEEEDQRKKHRRASMLNETGDLEAGFSLGVPIVDGQEGLTFSLGGSFNFRDPFALSLGWSLFQDPEGRVLPGNLKLDSGLLIHTNFDKGPPYAGIGAGCGLGLGLWPVDEQVRTRTVPLALVADRRWVRSLPESVVLSPHVTGFLSLDWLVGAVRIGSDIALPVYRREARDVQASLVYSFSFGGAFGEPKYWTNTYAIGGAGLVSFGEGGEHGFSLTAYSSFWWWKPWLEFFVSGSVPLVGETFKLEGIVHLGVDIGFEELLGKDPDHLPHR
ncbi:MAG TPA: hypothetical protein PK668_04480 [Myxococcota bacterium]|nr:hypothetical protein [Myxococcota bacterium]HRY92116.1 hypothetical protein [Myxococcota bacterium]HSA20937.1 hypothetical protein [Myxococcota bacterium]